MIICWSLAYVLIIACEIKYEKEHVLLMPLIAGSLNFAWEVNAVIVSHGFYGHVLWAALDVAILIHNIRYLNGRKRVWYTILVAAMVAILYGVFRIPDVDGQIISVFLIDLIMAVEYVVCAKCITPHGRNLIGLLRLLGDLLAWLINMRQSVFVAVVGLAVLLINLFYLAICLESDAQERKKVRR